MEGQKVIDSFRPGAHPGDESLAGSIGEFVVSAAADLVLERVGGKALERVAKAVDGKLNASKVASGAAGDSAKATASFGKVKTVLESAQAPYKGSTVIGHALSKHAGRNPDVWGKTTGSMNTWNDQAMKHLREIVRAPGEFKQVTTDKGLTFMEKWLPDGRVVRLNMDGTFKGFID
ncbi:hypothetical protein ACSC9U_23415 [Pseudomonas solani]|uniref:hypothetical protein n=1 Tax=Pseudomonas solani TaxID=2731552 RepID=UPI003F4AC7A0